MSQGIKGYIKLSITVLAPDDIKKEHDSKEEEEEDGGAMQVILPPFIQYNYKQLVGNILSTRYLPDISNRYTPTYSVVIEFGDTRIRSKEVYDEGEPEQIAYAQNVGNPVNPQNETKENAKNKQNKQNEENKENKENENSSARDMSHDLTLIQHFLQCFCFLK